MREIEHPGLETPSPVYWRVDLGSSSDLDMEALAQVLAGVAWEHGSDTFVLDERRQTTEWGSSGSFWELLATYALGMLTQDAYDLFKAAVRQQLKQTCDEARHPIGQDEARERAVAAVVTGPWDESADELSVDGLDLEPHSDGVTAVSLTSRSSGRRYRVTLELLDGLASVARVEMREGPTSGSE